MQPSTTNVFCHPMFSSRIDRVMEAGVTSVDDLYYIFHVADEFPMPKVLCHGDLWSGNMLFQKEYDTEGKAKCGDEVIAFVDWQVGFMFV